MEQTFRKFDCIESISDSIVMKDIVNDYLSTTKNEISVELDLMWTFVLVLLLAILAWIDFKDHRIPDWLNGLLAMLGALVAFQQHSWAGLGSSIFWAFVVFVFAYGFQRSYRLVRGVEGFGLGDVKFISAAVLWVGIQGIVSVVFVGSISGLLFVAMLALRKVELSVQSRVAFGPHLAVGLLVTWLTDIEDLWRWH